MKNPWQYAETNSEHGHQTALFMWASVAKQLEPRLDLLFAIPNGGKRDGITASRLKAEGVKSGVPDIMLPTKSIPLGWTGDCAPYAGMFIELKRPKSGRGSAGIEARIQIAWGKRLLDNGYYVCLCVGWVEAKRTICNYLGVDETKLDAYVMDKWPKGKS